MQKELGLKNLKRINFKRIEIKNATEYSGIFFDLIFYIKCHVILLPNSLIPLYSRV